jgi:predicted DNA-binding transcriptional regulator YafY
MALVTKTTDGGSNSIAVFIDIVEIRIAVRAILMHGSRGAVATPLHVRQLLEDIQGIGFLLRGKESPGNSR